MPRALAFCSSFDLCISRGADGGGTPLPWHQDGGEHWALDRDPLMFVWIALTQVRAGVWFSRLCVLPQFPAKIGSLVGAGHKSEWRSSGDFGLLCSTAHAVKPHTSHLTPHTSHLTPHTSHLTPHTSHLTPHTSLLTPHTSHLTPHTSLLTPHTSDLTPHTSLLT